MPTIVFISPKGGVGKTTSALLTAIQLAQHYDVTLIDADPNRPIKAWADGGNVPSRLTIVSNADEENIMECIEDAAARTPMVVVDLEGTAAKIVVYAVSQADFVVVPTQGSQLDATQANRAIRVVRQQEKMTGRTMPFAILMTRTNSHIRARTTRHIYSGLVEAGIPMFKTELNEREAFRAVFSFRTTMDKLDPKEVANVPKAQKNVADFTKELLRMLAAAEQARTAASAA